jgi:hypothetical protein
LPGSKARRETDLAKEQAIVEEQEARKHKDNKRIIK